MKVHVINTYEDFLEIKNAWNNLLKRSLHPFVFLTHEWMDAWWRAFRSENKLFIILVYDKNELIAIAPFMFNQGPYTVIGKTNTTLNANKIEFIANVHSNRADLILSDKPEQACDVIVSCLLNEYGETWDLLNLEYFYDDSPAKKHFLASLKKKDISCKQYFQMSTPYIPITNCWDDYIKNLQPRFKRGLNSRFKKLEENGPVKLISYKDSSELDKALDDVFTIAAKSWKAREGTALSSTPLLKSFYRDLAYTAAREAWLELYILYAGNTPVVFDFCLLYENTLYDLKTEFDETYHEFGVGNTLKWMQFDAVFKRNITEFDFLGPSMTWKRIWAKENERKHVIVCAFNKSYKGQLLQSIFSIKDFAKKLFKLTTHG